MVTITVNEIQRDPEGYLRRVEAGESFVVLRDKRPVAEIKPVLPVSRPARPYGLCRGQFTVPDDFDAPLPEDVIKDFEGQ